MIARKQQNAKLVAILPSGDISLTKILDYELLRPCNCIKASKAQSWMFSLAKKVMAKIVGQAAKGGLAEARLAEARLVEVRLVDVYQVEEAHKASVI